MITYEFNDHVLLSERGSYQLIKKIGGSNETESFQSLSHVATKLLAERLEIDTTDPLQNNINKALEAIVIREEISRLEYKLFSRLRLL